ncbi:glycosyltransferase [Synechococcus sp. CS-1329]|uniref:glycosyltransferase n=1 Tax=Synechococcus sp. CS-1329 TaxID=2847975 RepID=UPI00223AF8C3|nr:glycosyltransferase [Synechococcus sp. CS-1329]MCT0218875.1 glycosyltransferase [Synechococcus sp. CS-1329]
MSTAPPLILLVGMHRSGTSLLGSLLSALGISLPGTLIDRDPHNPEGSYEREDITALQEQLLIDLGRWWPSTDGVLPLPAGWLEAPSTRTVGERLLQVLASAARQQDGPWAVKDPRTSLLLPLWRQLAEQLDLPLRLVLGVRDPAEVMLSLVPRDGQAAGMTPWRAQQLWWKHNRQVLLDGAGLPLLIVDHDAWFEPTAADRQLDRLARFCGLETTPALQRAEILGRIRPEHRRSLPRDRLPLALHPQVRRLHHRLQALAGPPGPAGERRWQRLHAALAPSRLELLQPEPSLRRRLRHRWSRFWSQPSSPPDEAAAAPAYHPWRAAALACAGGDPAAGEALLQHWLRHGLSAPDLERIRQAPAACFPERPPGRDPGAQWPRRCRVVALGTHLRDWTLQAWLQHCPLPEGFEPLDPDQDDPGTEAVMALQLRKLPTGAESLDLVAWSTLPLVLDPDPGRVLLLQRLGIQAHPLVPGDGAAGWLGRADDLAAASARLGLPPPGALRGGLGEAAGGGETVILCLGTAGEAWEKQLELDPSLLCLPGFDQLQLPTMEDARLLASWLDAATRLGLQLVRLDPREGADAAFSGEIAARVGRALRPPDLPPGPHWLPTQYLSAPLSPSELREELLWRWSGRPAPTAPMTPRPEVVTLWQGGSGEAAPKAAVCISLFNYADRILAALESVQRQSALELELIVVDDGSSDGGPKLARTWMESHSDRFSRSSLLAHTSNGGLAAARNTAFAAAEAPWCFVLDADNELHPRAVDSCLAVAEASPSETAVVHPLVMVHREGPAGQPTDRSILSRVSWQRGLLEGGNQIDAMAMIRRSAWEAVGGYSHIEGGWEDYDFWCKLIDSGFHGVLCPQPLATYRAHDQSMTATITTRGLRRISRLLQSRHPWLKLPWATDQFQQEVD